MYEEDFTYEHKDHIITARHRYDMNAWHDEAGTHIVMVRDDGKRIMVDASDFEEAFDEAIDEIRATEAKESGEA